MTLQKAGSDRQTLKTIAVKRRRSSHVDDSRRPSGQSCLWISCGSTTTRKQTFYRPPAAAAAAAAAGPRRAKCPTCTSCGPARGPQAFRPYSSPPTSSLVSSLPSISRPSVPKVSMLQFGRIFRKSSKAPDGPNVWLSNSFSLSVLDSQM